MSTTQLQQMTNMNREEMSRLLVSKSTPATVCDRIRALQHLSRGLSVQQVASEMHVSQASVRSWRSSFLTKGIEGITNTSLRTKMTSRQKKETST